MMPAAEDRLLGCSFFAVCRPSLGNLLVVPNNVCYNYKKRSFKNAMEEV